MAMEPRIAAFSVLGRNWNDIIQNLAFKFSDQELNLYHRMLEKNLLKTSSMGRIFDAVASLLDISDRQSYEGEAAQLLEALALRYFVREGLPNAYPYDNDLDSLLSPTYILRNISRKIKNGRSKGEIAAGFHLNLVQMIDLIATKHQVDRLAFSGGVFQNGLLVDLILHFLSPKYKLYFHKNLSPNDEGISFGQLVYTSFCSKRHRIKD